MIKNTQKRCHFQLYSLNRHYLEYVCIWSRLATFYYSLLAMGATFFYHTYISEDHENVMHRVRMFHYRQGPKQGQMKGRLFAEHASTHDCATLNIK